MMHAPSGPTRMSAQTHTHSGKNKLTEIARVLVQEPVTHQNKTNEILLLPLDVCL